MVMLFFAFIYFIFVFILGDYQIVTAGRLGSRVFCSTQAHTIPYLHTSPHPIPFLLFLLCDCSTASAMGEDW